MFRKLGSAVALAILLGGLAVPYSQAAFGSTTSLVVGSLKTVDGIPVSKVSVSFSPKQGGSFGKSTVAKTDNKGQFLLQIPAGDYRVTLNSGNNFGSKCLSSEFDFQVVDSRQEINILAPSLQTYKFSFVGSNENKIIASVNPRFQNIQYESVDSPGIGTLKFSCRYLNFYNQPIVIWVAFKISNEQSTEKSPFGPFSYSASYVYQGATGQEVQSELPLGWWSQPNVVVRLENIPSLQIKRDSLRFSNGFIYGQAEFSELSELNEFDLSRKFNIRFRETSRGKLWPWRSFHPKFTVNQEGLLKFRVPAGFRGLTKLEIVVVGNNFAVQSNTVTVKMPLK